MRIQILFQVFSLLSILHHVFNLVVVILVYVELFVIVYFFVWVLPVEWLLHSLSPRLLHIFDVLILHLLLLLLNPLQSLIFLTGNFL